MSVLLLAEAVNIMRAAIAAGDWRVDGACDPDWLFHVVDRLLRESGYVQNSVDAHWQIET